MTLDVTTGTKGRVNIEARSKTRGPTVNSATAVSDFSNSTIYYTNVISGLLGGPGIDVMPISDSGSMSGYWRIRASV